MRNCSRFLLAMVCGLLGAAPAAAQSGSSAVVRDFTSRLTQAKLDSFAARVPGSEDNFVAALYLPGQQLIVVSGRYAAPALLREKILSKRYRDAYVDMFSASDRSSRRVVEDLKADGLQPEKLKDGAFDMYTRRSGESVAFDGDWKRRKLSQEAYMDAFKHADSTYADMVKVLISELQADLEPVAAYR